MTADDIEFVHAAKGKIVPREEGLEGFLGCLLAVIQRAFHVRRLGAEKDLAAPQVLAGFGQPRLRVCDPRRVRRHTSTCPLAEPWKDEMRSNEGAFQIRRGSTPKRLSRLAGHEAPDMLSRSFDIPRRFRREPRP